MIPDEVISEIRERTDIVALVGEYVTLKRRGANFVGLCPFHTEKTPSFNVHRLRRFYHCFGCQASGDAIAFIMQIEGRSFPEAVRLLAERAGIELPEIDEEQDPSIRRARAKKERLYALVEAAARFYRQKYESGEEAAVAREELGRRGIDEETAASFQLGYAPDSWDALSHFIRKEGLSPAEAQEVGLLIPRRTGSGFYDRFRNRLMFPVSDIHGRVVAFSGRALQPLTGEPLKDEPKYVNSPENPLYVKGALLFGLHQARTEIRRKGWAALCEGNFDLLSLHQAGIRNAVAPLGTAFTQDQAELLRRLTQRITLLFDADSAGRKAVRAAYPLLARSGLSGRVVALPEGDDPDTFLRKKGVEALVLLMERSRGIAEYLIDDAAETISDRAADRAAAIQELGPVIALVESPVERQIYIERVAQRFQIKDTNAVREELRKGARAHRSRWSVRPDRTEDAKSRAGSKQAGAELPELESALLGVLLDIPELFTDPLAKKLDELLTSPDLRSIFRAAASMVRETGEIHASTLLSGLGDDSSRSWLQGRLAIQKYDSETLARDDLKNGVMRLRKQGIERELRSLARQISEARRAGDDDRARVMTEQYAKLSRSAISLMQDLKG